MLLTYSVAIVWPCKKDGQLKNTKFVIHARLEEKKRRPRLERVGCIGKLVTLSVRLFLYIQKDFTEKENSHGVEENSEEHRQYVVKGDYKVKYEEESGP